jgi:hypothetical protein
VVEVRQDIIASIGELSELDQGQHPDDAYHEMQEFLSGMLQAVKEAHVIQCDLDMEDDDVIEHIAYARDYGKQLLGVAPDTISINRPLVVPHSTVLVTGSVTGSLDIAVLIFADDELYYSIAFRRGNFRAGKSLWLPDVMAGQLTNEDEAMIAITPVTPLLDIEPEDGWRGYAMHQGGCLLSVVFTMVGLFNAHHEPGCGCPEDIVKLPPTRH